MSNFITWIEGLQSSAAALVGILIGSVLSFLTNFILQERRLWHERDMLRKQNMSKENAIKILKEALLDKKHAIRSFEHLQKKVPFQEERLIDILMEAGAEKTTLKDGRVGWYLTERKNEVKERWEGERNN